MKKVIILGASGSIGQQTIQVIRENPHDFEIVAISVGKNKECLLNLIKEFPSIKAIYSIEETKDTGRKAFFGENGLTALLDSVKYDICINALVGSVGFVPSLRVLETDHTLCLANKETLVIGGFLINELLKNGHGKLIPIDSEHCGVLNVLNGRETNSVKSIILTTSGGALRNLPHNKLASIKISEALNHPTWKMGNKITIDSATMMNKALEVIEAYYLFNVDPKNILVLQHSQSKVHALVQLKDNSLIAEISNPDMKNSIRFALYNGNYVSKESVNPIDILNRLDFSPISNDRYPLLDLAYFILENNLLLGVVFNTINDILVDLLLREEINFLEHEKILKHAILHFDEELKKRSFHKSLSTVLYLIEASKNYLIRRWKIGG